MATVTLSPPPTAQTDRLYRISLEMYHRMAELGILTKHDKIVLLDGLLVTKMTRYPPHVTSTLRTHMVLFRLVADRWHVRKEDPISLPGGPTGRDSEPEPDVTVVRGSIDDYTDHHPGPADIGLVVDIADSSLADDRAGLVRYAWAGIPTAWIVNLPEARVEVYSEPTGPDAQARYLKVDLYKASDHVPVVLDGTEVGRIAAKELLP
jgi:Uma2 family endonuclease